MELKGTAIIYEALRAVDFEINFKAVKPELPVAKQNGFCMLNKWNPSL